MSNFEKRLEKLEQVAGVDDFPVTRIELVGMSREPDGPLDMNCAAVWCRDEPGFLFRMVEAA